MTRTIIAAAMGLVLGLSALPAAAQYMDLNTIVMDIGSTKFRHAVEIVEEAASVRVQRLSTLTSGTDTAAWVDGQTAGKDQDIRYLQRAVALNPIAMRAVKYANVSLDQIIGVIAQGDNAAVIFANDL